MRRPSVPHSTATRPSNDAAGSASAKRPLVFVVDQDPHVFRLLQWFVGGEYLLELFGDGYAALDRVRKTRPAALITEILVPQLDGLTLCRLLKADPLTAGVPILVWSMMSSADRARQSGADDFFEKPLEKQRLLTSLRRLIELPQRGAGA